MTTEPPQRLPELPPRRRPEHPEGRLDGQVALVTGAAGGIGKAVVSALATEYACVLATDADVDAVRESTRAAEVDAPGPLSGSRQRGAQIVAARLEVTDPIAWRAALRTARRAFGAVDVLVHCAGVAGPARLDRLDRREWDHVIEVNQTSFLLGLQACLTSMWVRGGGSVVAVGSVFGQVSAGGAFAYHASKGALHAMVTAAAVELAPRRIRVNAVLPGLVRTEMTADIDEQFVARYRQSTPLDRLATPADVAAGVLFLASDEADFVTGALLPVDGGYTSR